MGCDRGTLRLITYYVQRGLYDSPNSHANASVENHNGHEPTPTTTAWSRAARCDHHAHPKDDSSPESEGTPPPKTPCRTGRTCPYKNAFRCRWMTWVRWLVGYRLQSQAGLTVSRTATGWLFLRRTKLFLFPSLNWSLKASNPRSARLFLLGDEIIPRTQRL